MKNKYVNPQLLKEEANKFRSIVEYKYFSGDLSEEDDKKVDQLTMDDFQTTQPPQGGVAPPAGGGAPPPEGGGAPPAGGDQPPAPEGGAPEAGAKPDAAGGDLPPVPEPAAGAPEAGGEPTEEVDVTDIVNDTKETSQKTDEVGGKVDKTLQMVQALMAKIGNLEGNVSKMDQALAKIDTIYKEFQLSKPPSPEEMKQAMADKSYPFNVQLDKYGQEGTPKNQTEMESKNKKLSLSGLLSDFNERDVRNSFNPPDPFEDKVSRALPGYRI
jgi:hypothetical protein